MVIWQLRRAEGGEEESRPQRPRLTEATALRGPIFRFKFLSTFYYGHQGTTIDQFVGDNFFQMKAMNKCNK